ncbi:MAG: FliA/WhiG family RNA polymerase sigma factor [Angelakisella sp.]|nr:FliA/WhiG family RNA polymerase sigma factor [Angelakisella sp.]
MNTTLASETTEQDNQATLFDQYMQSKDISLRNELVMKYSYIAKTVALQMRGITANYAQVEDIVNQGVITLIDCVEKFDPSKGIKFESYAFMRVRGAVIDFVRKQDWLPRRVRMTAKSITAAHDELCNELMREPTQQEIADRLDMPLKMLDKHYGEISNSVMLSFEGIIQNVNQMGNTLENILDEQSNPENKVFKDELKQVLSESIDSLTQREKEVVTLYYYENLRLSDISKILKVSDQRVSQIISKAVQKLKYKMERYMKG